jgi:hypothetical protein
MRFCGKCGAQISEKAIYCEMCGIKLIDIPNETSNKDTAKENNLPEPDKSTSEIEELDLTKLDKKMNMESTKPDEIRIDIDTTSEDDSNKNEEGKAGEGKIEDGTKKKKNIIDLKDVLESEEKVEMDDKIRREVLADEEEFYKVCPMCGEEITINKKLLENTPVLVKCLKCGQETKIW